MKLPLTGSCSCGAVHLAAETGPQAMYRCHCKGCQETFHAAFAPVAVFGADDVSVRGELALATSPRGGAHHGRSVCRACGDTVLMHGEPGARVVLIPVAVLDDAGWFRPVADIWTVHAEPAAVMDYRIPKVLKSPPILGGEPV